jgi:hypothetical protein
MNAVSKKPKEGFVCSGVAGPGRRPPHNPWFVPARGFLNSTFQSKTAHRSRLAPAIAGR